MREYLNPATEDPILLRWYRQLVETGDLKTLFRVEHWPLSAFFQVFQNPTTLYFETDAEGEIIFAAWGTPMSVGVVAIDLWVAAGHRHSKETIRNVLLVLDAFLKTHRLVVATTASEAVASEHQKIGFTLLGKIPNFIEGEDAFVTYLTRDDFTRATMRLAPLLEADADG